MIIVVGVDETEQAARAARRALEEAERWEAELHVVNVLDLPLPMEVTWQPVWPLEEYQEAARQAVWERIDPVLEESRVEVRKVGLEGYPPDSLVRYAREVGASLLVLGTRGRGELASLVLGSTSHRALHSSPCDVLIVKRPGTEAP